jgi:hypothetical protein
MINKIYKRIHNKYSTLFKFIFFLRYLFGIFFIVFVLFLLIPNFFDYQKRDKIIKNYLLESYGLKLNKYENIKFNSLPVPNLEIFNASLNFNTTSVRLDVQNLNIYPKLVNIYNFKNFKAKKIVFNKNKIALQTDELKILSKYIYKLENKFTLKNLEIKIFRDDEFLINLKNINLSNYGYNKNTIRGEVFNKKFKMKMDNNLNKLNFNLLNTGINVDLIFNKTKEDLPLNGIVKAKLLNSNLKFNFEYNKKNLKIYNSYYRSKNLSFNNENIITFKPFFDISSIYNIEDINLKLLNNFNLNKILNAKDIIKKINIKNKINYESKKFSRSFIDDLNLDINLAYGRLVYSKKFFISKSFFNCKGDTNLLVEYPILNFNCLIISKDKKKLLKEFSINYKIKKEPFNLNFKGNLNILNNKINFTSIKVGKNYDASKEDLKYFKDVFESILFNKNFINIFRLDKIKNFILEVS